MKIISHDSRIWERILLVLIVFLLMLDHTGNREAVHMDQISSLPSIDRI